MDPGSGSSLGTPPLALFSKRVSGEARLLKRRGGGLIAKSKELKNRGAWSKREGFGKFQLSNLRHKSCKFSKCSIVLYRQHNHGNYYKGKVD